MESEQLECSNFEKTETMIEAVHGREDACLMLPVVENTVMLLIDVLLLFTCHFYDNASDLPHRT